MSRDNDVNFVCVGFLVAMLIWKFGGNTVLIFVVVGQCGGRMRRQLACLPTILDNYLLMNISYNTWHNLLTIRYIMLVNGLQYAVITYRKNSQQITKRHALTGEKEFPLLLKFPLTIRRRIRFYLDFILH